MNAFLPIEALASMSTEAQAIAAGASAPAQAAPLVPTQDPAAGAFDQLVTDGLANVNEQLIGSQVDLQKLALGDAQNLHQVMIGMEESRLSFQLMMQVRSRLLDAYQDVMKMPI